MFALLVTEERDRQSATGPRSDDRHHHLVWHLGGPLRVDIGDRTSLVPPGAGIWIPASTRYELTGNPRFSVGTAAIGRSRCPQDWERTASVVVSPLLRQLLAHLTAEVPRPQRLHAEQLVLDLLHDALSSVAVDLPLPAEPRCRAVAEGVLADPASDWELADWAHEVGTGARNLTRVFHAETGMSFGRWRTRARVHASLAYLANGVPVSEVSRRVGYGSPSTFVRAFRRTTGHTPTEYTQRQEQMQGRAGSRGSPARHIQSRQTPLSAAECAALLEGTPMFKNAPQGTLQAALVAMSLFVAACGGTEGDSDGSTTSLADPPPTTTTDIEEANTTTTPLEPIAFGEVTILETTDAGRLVHHHDGETLVPLDPSRVVSVDVADGLVALGVSPIGASNWESNYLGDFLNGAENLGPQFELNLEALASLRPDLIVAHNGGADEGYQFFDLLDEIAPTVTILDPEIDFKLSQRQIGAILGQEAAAEARIQEYDEHIAQAQVALDSVISDGTVALVNIRADHFRLYGVKVGYTGPYLYGQLEMRPSTFVTDYVPANEANVDISIERLHEIDADHVIVLYAEDLEAEWADLQSDPLWQRVGAVQAGNVYPVVSNYWYASGLIAHELKSAELTESVSQSQGG